MNFAEIMLTLHCLKLTIINHFPILGNFPEILHIDGYQTLKQKVKVVLI